MIASLVKEKPYQLVEPIGSLLNGLKYDQMNPAHTLSTYYFWSFCNIILRTTPTSPKSRSAHSFHLGLVTFSIVGDDCTLQSFLTYYVRHFSAVGFETPSVDYVNRLLDYYGLYSVDR